ncbi:DUF7604 domain-containing protein [Bifidobacterium adolescentis]|uniref:DUF7604 domain-containing protein n=1 Tax=Bifidobacterium adolescentis TaxID=1680 RepID=UPI003BB7B307
MRRAYAQRRVKTGDAFTRRILATIISIAMLVGMGGVGVSVASAEEDATAVDTSAVIEPQAGQQEVEPAETASESQTKQQDEDQAERPDEEQTKQQTEPNGVASEQGDAAKSNDVASEQDDADSIQSITQSDDQPIVLAAQPTALANQIQPAAESETGSQLLEETFKNSNFADPDSWSTKDGACLTAKTRGCTSTKDSTAIQGHKGNGYLQLTDNSESAKGSVLYNQPIISKNGLHVSFDYYMYHTTSSGLNTPGDGIGFFLVDGAATLQQTGAAGAGLGYATNDEDGTGSKAREEGVAQGVLGIGLDRFGNFSTQHASGTKNRVTGGDDCGQWENPTGPNSITLRGKGIADNGKWTKGYCIVTSRKVASGLDTKAATNAANDTNGKRVDITIAPLANATATTQKLTVKIDGATVLEHDIDHLPDSVKFGFSASTGAAHQVQLIRGLSVYSMTPLSQLDLVKSVDKDKYPNADTHVFQVGDQVPYKFVVRNSGNTRLSNITVNDPNITNVSCDARTLAPGAQTQCSGTLTITESLVGENGTFTNTATATATDADGKSVTSPQAQATIHVNKPLGAPEKHKRIKKNGDGTYTLNVDVKGAASSTTVTTTQPIDFTLVLDVSGSMDDPMSKTDRTKRLVALKTAVGSFLDGAAKANKGAQSGSEPVRVGLVKFAGDKTDKIGDDMYRSGGYTYNYSQIVSDLTANMNGLKNKVSKLKAAGATQADNGFNLAVKVMGSASARTDAKKVVIFFADGSPTSSSGFEGKVANKAVEAAKELKDGGATVYSIGIFASANPSSLSSNENQFMHAVSSNFPKATKYNQRGEGNIEAGYYKSATNASELNTIFDEIEKSETTTSAYTKVTMEDTLSGYVELADSTYKVVAKDASGKVVSLTKNVDYTLTYDASTKKFTVAFLKPLVNNVTYTLEYNVKPTQKAYDEYAANLNAGKDGYDGVKGDANTDLPGNATSSNQPGFHANDSACLAYSADGVDHKCSENPYPHPVAQVVSSTLHIDKQWSGNGQKPESITVDIKQGNDTYKTVTLKRDDSGKWSTDVIIPAGAQKTYTVTEVEPDSHLWKASYQHKVGDGNLADGNVVTVPESMASQNATVVITNTLKQTMLTHAIGVQKELVGRDWKDSDEFTFKLKADDSNPDAPMPASCKNQSACTVTVKRDSSDDHVAYFGDITYDAGEAEYTYLVTENAGNASAMYYSQAEYRVVVSVMKDGTSGEWKAVVESVTQLKTDYGAAGSNWDETQPMLFTNQYISASSLPLTGRMGAERWWQIAAGGVGVLALLAVAAADQWRRKKRLS